MKKHRYQIAACVLSIIMIISSLSVFVFAAGTSGETTAEVSVVKDIEELEKSETEKSSESIQYSDKTEKEQNQSVLEEKVDNYEEEKKEYSADILKKETAFKETNEEEKDEGYSVKKENLKLEKDAVTPSLGIEKDRETENSNIEEINDEVIPEETVRLYLGSGINTLEYEHDDALTVQFEMDPDLKIEYLICEGNYTFTTITSEIRILPLGVGNGTIKVIDFNSNKVLKIFNVVIEPSTDVEELTICKGTHEWISVGFVTSPFLDWNVSDGINIKIKDTEEDYGFLDDDTNYPITYYNFVLAVKGKQIGDYSVSFYNGSEDNIYSTLICHIVDHDYQDSVVQKEVSCEENGIIEKICKNCGDKVTEEIPAPGHIWNEDYTVDKEATCTEEGSESIHCSVCNEINKDTVRAIPKKSARKFSDVPSTYAFHKQIEWASDKGIVSGYSDGTFRPQGVCKRKQVVAFLWRLKGSPAPKSTAARFSDVSTKTDFYKAIYWASENNIVLGFGNGTFRPEDTCTRGQVVAFLWRLAGRPAPKGSNSKFSDVTKTSSFFKAILWASENGIVQGYSDGTFRPDNTCTRGQIVAFIYRYANLK